MNNFVDAYFTPGDKWAEGVYVKPYEPERPERTAYVQALLDLLGDNPDEVLMEDEDGEIRPEYAEEAAKVSAIMEWTGGGRPV